MVSKSNVSKWRLNISWLRKICAWMWRKSGLFHVWAGNLAWGGWQLILWFSPFSCIQHGLNKWAIGWGWFALSRQTEAHMEVKTWKLTRVVRGHWRWMVQQRNQSLHPRKLTCNLKRMVSKRNLLFQGFIFRFHVSFLGSTNFTSHFLLLRQMPCVTLCEINIYRWWMKSQITTWDGANTLWMMG